MLAPVKAMMMPKIIPALVSRSQAPKRSKNFIGVVLSLQFRFTIRRCADPVAITTVVRIQRIIPDVGLHRTLRAIAWIGVRSKVSHLSLQLNAPSLARGCYASSLTFLNRLIASSGVSNSFRLFAYPQVQDTNRHPRGHQTTCPSRNSPFSVVMMALRLFILSLLFWPRPPRQ